MGTGADSLPELLQLCLKPHTFQQEPSAWAFLNSLFISFIKGIRQVGICMKRILWEYCLQGRYFHDFPHPGALSVCLSLSLLLDGALKEAALIFQLIWGKKIIWAAYIQWKRILFYKRAVTKKWWDLSCLILLMGFVIIIVIPNCFQVFLTQDFLMTIAFVIQKERESRQDNSKIILIKQRQTLN